MADTDGQFSYSKIISIQANPKMVNVFVYSNPGNAIAAVIVTNNAGNQETHYLSDFYHGGAFKFRETMHGPLVKIPAVVREAALYYQQTKACDVNSFVQTGESGTNCTKSGMP